MICSCKSSNLVYCIVKFQITLLQRRCEMDTSNAFTNPTSGKIDQQRKILEDLERQKKQLLKSGGGPSLPVGLPPVPLVPTTEGAAHLTASQRQSAALDSVTKSSLGYFIHQDSAFGNVILPVIPRLPPKPQTTKN